jgi:lysophospholipase L1-like esterase
MTRGIFRPSIETWQDYIGDQGFPSFPDLNLLAEGDSWFTISGLPAYNLLFELRFHKQTRIVNCGMPGDTIKHMSEIVKNPQLRAALAPGERRWDAILLSGGGNDLIDAADVILLPKARRTTNPQGPRDYCDETLLNDLIKEIQDGYRRIADARDAPGAASRGVPILIHTYDYATPRNAPARFVFARIGPWLFRALKDREVPSTAWVPVADYLTDALADGILALASGSKGIPAFHVVDTRGTLTRADLKANADSQDWQNEIHPNGGGYEKLAKRIEPVLDGLLPLSG